MIQLQTNSGPIPVLIDESDTPSYVIVLAHGAGAPMQHPFMESLSHDLAIRSGNVVRFNFPYIVQGRKSPGAPAPNIQTILDVVKMVEERFPGLPIVLSGKSYGGRMSSHLLHQKSELQVTALVYFGFPLHAPGKPGIARADHLYELTIPQLFIQGTRDALADYTLIRDVVGKCPHGHLITIEHGDHSFGIPKRLKHTTPGETITEIADFANEWICEMI